MTTPRLFSRSIVALGFLLVASGVRAETLNPVQAKTIDLGTMGGTVYYTIQPDGYRVVATLGTELPVRFIVTLSPEQSIFLSTPRKVSEPAIQVRIMRHGEQLLVDGGSTSPDEFGGARVTREQGSAAEESKDATD